MKQITLFQSGILPKQQSRVKKELTDKQKHWLELHKKSNWKTVGYYQDHKNSKRQIIRLNWRLAGTEDKKDTCGLFKTLGCGNTLGHPQNGVYVNRSTMGCFRFDCPECWLTKWLARESSRATRRIERYQEVWTSMNNQLPFFGRRKFLSPVHIVCSIPKWKYNLRFDEMKKELYSVLTKCGITGGCCIFHPFRQHKNSKLCKCGLSDCKQGDWYKSPHFHCVGFGWVTHTNLISNKTGWFIKNLGVRKSMHSTIYYQLSHAGSAGRQTHTLFWFASLGYRAKFAFALKEELEEDDNFCPYCGSMLVHFRWIGYSRRPPNFEFVGLEPACDWEQIETIAEAVDYKNRFKKKRRQLDEEHYFNEECKKARDVADALIRKLTGNTATDITATDTATMDTTLDGELCSVPS